jgi:hypothetical protein
VLLTLSCLCATGCGGCIEDNSSPPPPSPAAQTPQSQGAAPTAPIRALPVPLRGLHLMIADAGAAAGGD